MRDMVDLSLDPQFRFQPVLIQFQEDVPGNFLLLGLLKLLRTLIRAQFSAKGRGCVHAHSEVQSNSVQSHV